MKPKQHIAQIQTEQTARIIQPDRDHSHIESGDGDTARINTNTRISEIISPAMGDDTETTTD